MTTKEKNAARAGVVRKRTELPAPWDPGKPPKIVLTKHQQTVLLVSLVWIVVGLTIVTFLVNSQAQYNRGVYDGMTRTKSILQGK